MIVLVGPIVTVGPGVHKRLTEVFVLYVEDSGSPEGMRSFIDSLRTVRLLGHVSDSPFDVNRTRNVYIRTVHEFSLAVIGMTQFSARFNYR
jgi:hypothetical protein